MSTPAVLAVAQAAKQVACAARAFRAAVRSPLSPPATLGAGLAAAVCRLEHLLNPRGLPFADSRRRDLQHLVWAGAPARVIRRLQSTLDLHDAVVRAYGWEA
jgi:hypothetical protein